MTMLFIGCGASNDVTDNQDTKDGKIAEEVIYDVFPVDPEAVNFGKDNMGVYMEGIEFKLPMAYSDFLAKVTELGFSINEDWSKDLDGQIFMTY